MPRGCGVGDGIATETMTLDSYDMVRSEIPLVARLTSDTEASEPEVEELQVMQESRDGIRKSGMRDDERLQGGLDTPKEPEANDFCSLSSRILRGQREDESGYTEHISAAVAMVR